MKMRIAFDSNESKILNDKIFETIYFAALNESLQLSKKKAEKMKTPKKFAGAYSSFEGSPLSFGEFQFDLWGVPLVESTYDWNKLREEIKQHGVMNSLLVAPMPTASTAQILGNNECFEPITSNIYVRRTLAGEFVLVNKHLQDDLMSLGKWTEETKNIIIRDNGSVKNLTIPETLKNVYKTVWEISQKTIIDLAADRGKYIDQSQSMNLFFNEAITSKVTSALFYAWKKGLKTGCYYLRTRPQSSAQKFTIEPPTAEVCESCSG
jgi:ribonucleoside-diphosphate reductase alpha chain